MLTVHFYELCFVSFRNSHSESCMVKLLKNLGCLCWFIKEILTRKGVFTVSLNISNYTENWALPRWLSSKESACKYVDQETLIRKIPRSGRPPGEGNGNPLQYPGKFHRQRSLGSCSPWGRRRVGHDLVTKQQREFWKASADMGEISSWKNIHSSIRVTHHTAHQKLFYG